MAGRFGARIDDFYMVFMRSRADRLERLFEVNDPKGRPAVGLGGRCGADVDALSLVFE